MKKVACSQDDCASSLTTRSLGLSSAITLTARGCEFGIVDAELASAAELMRRAFADHASPSTTRGLRGARSYRGVRHAFLHHQRFLARRP